MVEDNPDDIELMLREFKKEGVDFEVDIVGTGEACLETLAEKSYNIVLLDYKIPKMNGLEVLEKIVENNYDVPVVMVTGRGDEKVAVEAMKQGASDYVVKSEGYLIKLPLIIQNAVEKHETYKEKERLKREIEETKDFLDNIIKSSADAIVTADLDSKITTWSNGAEELYGYKAKKVIGKSMIDLYPPDLKKERLKWLDTLMKGGVIRNKKTKIYNKDGKLLDISLSLSLLKDSKGKPIGTVGVSKDISREMEAEEALQKYTRDLEEANRLKDLFTDIMTHDLLGPAGAIRNATELMRDEVKGAGKELMDIIEWGAKKQIGMIESASRLSKLESTEDLEKQSLDLKEVIGRAVEDTRHLFEEAGMQTENRVTKPMPVKANPMIEDVFFNLLSNAAKYTTAGKKVVIKALDEGESYRVMVKDYGPGIPDKDRESIFTRFIRRKKASVKGTGLGLAIAKKIIELHNGRIWVEDNPDGRGSVFFVELPK